MSFAYPLLLSALTATLVGVRASAPDEATTRVRPRDNGAVLSNPGMGWVLHYYDNVPANYGSRLKPSDTVDDFPGLTVVYLRIPWSCIEPEEGRFCWSVLDTPAQRWLSKGKQIALRISACESWTRYATPQWVEKAGAKGHSFRVGPGAVADGPFWEPDYDVFISVGTKTGSPRIALPLDGHDGARRYRIGTIEVVEPNAHGFTP